MTFASLSRVRRGTAPLWPAGHLPLKGGDRLSHLLSPITNVARRMPWTKLPISPLEGEMSGRTEGGALAPTHKFGGPPWVR
ncbi:lytic murein transglycosylase [Mesorhizobium sp. M4A.F.Ca.ET.020.02.1.1]|nr:lytic murein transglycosylase [Mesorhizobium sp. M4A.F.Ca.ET.050.02.1.1]RVD33973.1 lytic murein transglycosylase [Mesorhizobium sp. M4A.F.Ca.ET.020.02.1.1]RWC15897.1 MAG: lytic murein transglycosylase [Mesorhizobium sp.]RWD23213.1 MAG: lytic murein transglycosylase [Mesorhizobium sp.]RWD28546.1 MAG: lytic murein transglycosylase [Mesorhizobium sp.]